MIMRAYFLNMDDVEDSAGLNEVAEQAFVKAKEGSYVRVYVDGADGYTMILFDAEDIVRYWNGSSVDEGGSDGEFLNKIGESWPEECGMYVIDGRYYVSPDEVFGFIFGMNAIGLVKASGAEALRFAEYLGTRMCESINASYGLHVSRMNTANGGDEA